MNGTKTKSISIASKRLIELFEAKTGLYGVPVKVSQRSSGDVVTIYVIAPSDRFYIAAKNSADEVSEDCDKNVVASVQPKMPKNILKSPEVQLFLATLADSLTINRHSFDNDFFFRYTKSVFNVEDQIVGLGNHVVFGRRGAGKSILLLYALRTREKHGLPSVWIDMQTYAKRQGNLVLIDVLFEILTQLSTAVTDRTPLIYLLNRISALKNENASSPSGIDQILPDVRRFLQQVANERQNIAIFLDDFHVLDPSYQPELLGQLYKITRGNRVSIKLSAIDSFTRTWDPATQTGLQIPHDAQTIPLDLNLTLPDKAAAHIRQILDGHAQYCGLPSIRVTLASASVMNRLVWVSAGVPRDALSIFAKAMSNALFSSAKRVGITNVNVAASEMVSPKLADLKLDSTSSNNLENLFEHIREFCITEQKSNAFLREIKSADPTYEAILRLVDARLLHVISQGISLGKVVGRKYLAVILDYGFYTGMRTTRSVKLFNVSGGKITYEALRKLPVYTAHIPYQEIFKL